MPAACCWCLFALGSSQMSAVCECQSWSSSRRIHVERSEYKTVRLAPKYNAKKFFTKIVYKTSQLNYTPVRVCVHVCVSAHLIR